MIKNFLDQNIENLIYETFLLNCTYGNLKISDISIVYA
jgi:hypothetical protein